MRPTYTKIIAAVVLFILTFLASMLPTCLFRRPDPAGEPVVQRSRKLRAMSLLNCFGGGVFLGTCLLHLLPDVQRQIHIVVEGLKLDQDYPLSELLFCSGFLIVLIFEQIMLTYHESINPENMPVLNQQDPSLIVNNSNPEDNLHSGQNYGSIVIHPEHSSHQNHAPHSIFRSLLLVLALSLHSVFEGLAIGLQQTSQNVLRILLAVLIHKCIIAFTLGLNLSHSDLQKCGVIKSNFLFSCTSPVGIVIGLLVVDLVTGLALAITSGVLQGIAAGTFLYITLFEVLPPELNDNVDRLGKVTLVVTGFTVVSILLLFLPT